MKILISLLRAQRRIGPAWLKSMILDYENRSRGEFLHDHDENYRSRINDYIEQYCGGGNILDLGCSDSQVGYSLNVNLYSKYTGVDLSTVAIKKAIREHETAGKTRKNRFVVSEIYKYEPDDAYNVILFKDSIYYTNNSVILECLNRLAHSLTGSGVFIVHMDNIKRHERVRKLIHDNFDVLEENNELDHSGVLLIFRSFKKDSLSA